MSQSRSKETVFKYYAESQKHFKIYVTPYAMTIMHINVLNVCLCIFISYVLELNVSAFLDNYIYQKAGDILFPKV